MDLKRTAKYALTLVLGAGLVIPAMAQDNFPDVPENHWAYKELARLKAEGLLVGYPDGLFRGGRPASRYEMAVAIHAAWSNLKGITDGLKGQIDDIMSKISGGFATKADLDNLRAAVDSLSNQVKVNTDDIAALKRLIDEFRGELQKLGADVEQMKKDIASLDKRVTALEKSKLPFDVHGDLNLVALGGYAGKDDEYGVSVDGRPLGYGRGDYSGARVGVTRDLTILHEGALDLVSNNETGPKFYASFVFGNMLGSGGLQLGGFSGGNGFGNQSTVNSFEPFGEAEAAWYAQRFYVDFDTSVASLGFNAKVGRVGYKINPMMFQRPDNTPYFKNDRWDNGEWMFDGAILGFRFGSSKLNVFGGRNSARLATNGNEIQPMYAGKADASIDVFGQSFNELQIDQSLGAHLWLPLGDKGHINLAYLWLDSNTVVNNGSSVFEPFNRVIVYGGDFKYQLGGQLNVYAGYAKSDLNYNDTTVVDEDNSAWWAGLKYGGKNDKWGIGAGYKSIDPLYAAPGAWGRIGTMWNPVDLQGFHVDGWFQLSNNLKISASGGFMEGRDTDASILNGDDKVTTVKIGVDYKLSNTSSLMLAYENNMWDLEDNSGGKPNQSWYTLGFNFGLSSNANLRLFWQVSDTDADGVGAFSFFGQERARGGLIGTQLSVKF